MPLRSPGDPVVRDSTAGLWDAVREGIIDSTDITASGRLRDSVSVHLPTPSPSNWARDVHTSSPFGRQTRPFGPMPPSPAATPNVTPVPSPVAPPAPVRPPHIRTPLAPLTGSQVVRERIYKAELKWEEEKYPGQATREGLLRRFVALAKEVEVVLQR